MRRLALVCSAIALGAVLLAAFYAQARHVVPMNSDNATLVLEGQAMRGGDVSLSGWALPLDSFWSSEAPVYAVGLAFGLSSATLLYLGPALVAALTVLVAMWLARGSGTAMQRLSGPLLVLAVLGAAAPGLAFYLLQGAWHVGTTLLCLVAFAGLAARSRLGVGVAVVALTLALLGDLQALLLGVLPVLLCGAVAVARARRFDATAAGMLIAGVGASLLALGLHSLFETLGSFAVLSPNPTPPLAHEFANVARLPAREAGIAGVVSLPVHSATGGPLAARLLHGVGFAVVLFAIAAALVGLLLGCVGRRRDGREVARRWSTTTVDDLLLIAICGDLSDFVLLSGTGNGNYARYLTASTVFGAVLAGRAVTRLVARLPERRGVATSAGVGLFFAGALAALGSSYALPAVAEEPAPLGSFLSQQGLTNGVGDYWSSSIVTAETNGRVRVRPVIVGPSGRLMRYGRESATQWYANQQFSFVVFDTAHPWRDVDEATTLATFGRPARVAAVGSYRIFVYGHPFAVAASGFTRNAASAAGPERVFAEGSGSVGAPQPKAAQR